MTFIEDLERRQTNAMDKRAVVWTPAQANFRIESGYLRISVNGVFLRVKVEHVEEHQLDGVPPCA